jgi:hypothetical protein
MALAVAWAVSAAEAQQPSEQHQHPAAAPIEARWMFMQDGMVLGLFNHQGGPRGGDEFRAPNWWMGMTTRQGTRSSLAFSAMLSLDPATVGTRGYREIFQVGEAVDAAPLVDRQHPHDAFMQLAGVWRRELGDRTSLAIAGAAVGEPALGPVAFMHRPSAAELPLAPLGHHTFDSTHTAFGVITAAVDRGPFVLEGSLFNGREPDEHRWDFDFGRLDSLSARLWYTPTSAWELQFSTGHLKSPEAFEPGDIQRTTASAAWTRLEGRAPAAVAFGFGVNDTPHGTRHAMFAEATRGTGRLAISGRFEFVQVETGLFLGEADVEDGDHRTDGVAALTVVGTRSFPTRRAFEGSVGAAVTVYAVPVALRSTHGSRPVSLQVFFRLRPPAPMGRMWNARMSRLGTADTMHPAGK